MRVRVEPRNQSKNRSKKRPWKCDASLAMGYTSVMDKIVCGKLLFIGMLT